MKESKFSEDFDPVVNGQPDYGAHGMQDTVGPPTICI